MTIIPFVLDFCPAYIKGQGYPATLLLAPLGKGTFLSYLESCISAVSHESLMILPPSEPAPGYDQAIREAAGKGAEIVIAKEGPSYYIDRCEPSDWFLFVDPRFFPVHGYHLSKMVCDLAVSPCTRHMVAMESVPGGTKEYVVMNRDGQVRKIQRYYEGVTWVKTSSISCTLVSVSSACLVRSPQFASLSEFRRLLAAAGVPGVDLIPAGPCVDLASEANLLSVNEHFILQKMQREPMGVYRQHARNILVAPCCEIHSTVRIHGPVVVHSGARIEAESTIIGPAVIGERSHIQRNVTIAQCLIMPHMTVPANTTVRHRVVAEDSMVCLLDGAAKLENPMSVKPATLVTRQIEPHAVSDTASRRWYAKLKRVMDLLVCVSALILLSPLLLVVAVLVKLTSQGPVLFRHERECRGGKPFHCLKFRTMVKDAHARQRKLYASNEVDGPQFKLENDPRIMRLGKWLRMTNIDELPQLVNVLRGEMSLIGPRPSPFRENQICVPWRKARLSVRPGITGLWQVCRHERSAGDFHQWIYYDMLYVRHMSLWLDVKILLMTILTLGGRWSVPLSWLIPDRKLRDETEPRAVSHWSPLLRVLESN